jgi:uncharacterized protein YoxC
VTLSEVFLAVIAVAVLAMACLQVGAAIVMARIAREARQSIGALRDDVRPLVARVTALADDASRTTAAVHGQVEKVDRLVSEVSRRIDETSAVVQQAIVTPAREGIALMAALKAGLSAFGRFSDRRAHGRHAEDEDPLFIG